MSKPLTIDELKTLREGDWVWVRELNTYVKIKEIGQDNVEVYVSQFSIEFMYIHTFMISTYGTKWLAFKNKEQAEAKGEIVELPCKIGDPIWVVYRDFDHGFNEYKIYESICTGFAFENGTKIRIVTAFCCYDFDRVGNYTDKAEAERRLAELKGEKT